MEVYSITIHVLPLISSYEPSYQRVLCYESKELQERHPSDLPGEKHGHSVARMQQGVAKELIAEQALLSARKTLYHRRESAA